MRIYHSFGAGLCGHCKGREELIQLLDDINEDSHQGQEHVLDGFGCFVVEYIVGILWEWDVFLGKLCMGGACCN